MGASRGVYWATCPPGGPRRGSRLAKALTTDPNGGRPDG
jgi:hypothetical protein